MRPRAWLDALAAGQGRSAAFDTHVRGPFGGAAPAINEAREQTGYVSIAKPVRFVVAGRRGLLRGAGVQRAREWGAELATALE